MRTGGIILILLLLAFLGYYEKKVVYIAVIGCLYISLAEVYFFLFFVIWLAMYKHRWQLLVTHTTFLIAFLYFFSELNGAPYLIHDVEVSSLSLLFFFKLADGINLYSDTAVFYLNSVTTAKYSVLNNFFYNTAHNQFLDVTFLKL
jgi:AAA+ ATPase superfamily predicted ATPase